jgi:hypothetical protein
MALIREVAQAQRTPKTVDEVFDGLVDLNTKIYNDLKLAQRRAYGAFWHNQDVTPMQLAQKMGTDAAAYFMASAKVSEALSMMNPAHVPIAVPEGYEVAFGQDGTVTITKKDEPQPSA